jgi:Lrp/AsnC family transcriptional regulator for asnA, asnC and gidA
MVLARRIDDIDRAIIVKLQDDGRRALRDIARELGIAEATVRLRLKRLQEEEILQIVAFSDPTKFGPSLMSLVFVATESGKHDQIIATLEEWTEVSYLSTTLGETDICVQVVCTDQSALWELRQRVCALEGVTAVRFLSEVEVHKFRFKLPGI